MKYLLNDAINFKQQTLDPLSSSFCGKKWYDATIWLGSGHTASCFHNPRHQINLKEIGTNPAAIHNTQEKKLDRQMMQSGERPANCKFCWDIEDLGENSISDRVWHSRDYSDSDLQTAFNDLTNSDFTLQTLEMSFNRNCQFACAYCSSSISSAWGQEISQLGPYQGLTTDRNGAYTWDGRDVDRYLDKEVNPYVEAFFKWWETDLHKTLKLIRLTGGEPLMSQDIWRFLDLLAKINDRDDMRVHIETNLGHNERTIDRLLNKLKDINQKITIVVSGEATAAKGEYVRYGLNWDQWVKNIDKLCANDSIDELRINGTVTPLTLDGLIEFLDFIVSYKKRYSKAKLFTTMTPVWHPSFQSLAILPAELKADYARELQSWLDKNSEYITEFENENLIRLVNYLTNSPVVDSTRTSKDFKTFFTQYDQRRNLDLLKTFPRLTNWYNSL